jgi:hypothetical protein
MISHETINLDNEFSLEEPKTVMRILMRIPRIKIEHSRIKSIPRIQDANV